MVSIKLLELLNSLHITSSTLWSDAVKFSDTVRLNTKSDSMSTGYKSECRGASIWNLKFSVLLQLHHDINKQHE